MHKGLPVSSPNTKPGGPILILSFCWQYQFVDTAKMVPIRHVAQDARKLSRNKNCFGITVYINEAEINWFSFIAPLQGTLYPVHRIIAGKRKGKPYAYGASLTYPIMRNARFLPCSESGTFADTEKQAALLRYRYAEPPRKVKRLFEPFPAMKAAPASATGKQALPESEGYPRTKPPVLRTGGMMTIPGSAALPCRNWKQAGLLRRPAALRARFMSWYRQGVYREKTVKNLYYDPASPIYSWKHLFFS